MDYEKFQSFGQMPLTPDVLILPSELRYFVKVQARSEVSSGDNRDDFCSTIRAVFRSNTDFCELLRIDVVETGEILLSSGCGRLRLC